MKKRIWSFIVVAIGLSLLFTSSGKETLENEIVNDREMQFKKLKNFTEGIYI